MFIEVGNARTKYNNGCLDYMLLICLQIVIIKLKQMWYEI